MTTASSSYDIFVAAQLHLNVLDEFIAIAQAKLNETVNPFARDSLKDLIANLTEQRDSYAAFAEPGIAVAA